MIAAGRLLERQVDSGTGSRTRETRGYRRDGTIEWLDIDGGKRVEFDADERPVRIQVTDGFDRHDTNVTYPSPTEVLHATTGLSTSPRGGGAYEYTTRYRVRTPQELRGIEAPEFPTLRRHVRGQRHDETQTEYAAGAKVLVERRLDAGGNVVCISRTTYHPSGPPTAVRNERMQAKAACSNDLDNELETDERGNWAEQRMSLVQLDGQRRLMAVQTRRVEYLP